MNAAFLGEWKCHFLVPADDKDDEVEDEEGEEESEADVACDVVSENIDGHEEVENGPSPIGEEEREELEDVEYVYLNENASQTENNSENIGA